MFLYNNYKSNYLYFFLSVELTDIIVVVIFLFKKGYISINGVERLDSQFGNMVITVISIKKTERLYY